MVSEIAHAKLNLSLAVTGRREDGFHELVSLVHAIALADELDFEPGGPFRLICDDKTLPTDETNLVLRAALAYQKQVPFCPTGTFHLRKRIPSGAGLGGGSSDAAATLRLLNRSIPQPLSEDNLRSMAATIGSDCPFFISERAAIMRGRGERLNEIPKVSAQTLQRRRVLVVKPAFAISTPEAYGLLAQSGRYAVSADVEQSLQSWLQKPNRDPSFLGNTLEAAVFRKYIALPTALDKVSYRLGVTFRMTGSGSACFAFYPEGETSSEVESLFKELWGSRVWFCDTQLFG